jgi:hypothetical protein
MRGYVKGLMDALRQADQIDIHWTEKERDETLRSAHADLEYTRQTQDGIAECAGFTEGVKQAAPRLDGHDYSMPDGGGPCQICGRMKWPL